MNNDHDPKDPLLLDHEYDGIHELDNKLPRWWVWLFNLSIVFAVIYFGYYHVLGKGKLMIALDTLNQRYGKGTVLMGSSGNRGNDREWSMKQERRTPAYTTKWEDMPVAKA